MSAMAVQMVRFATGLTGGGRWIRTIGPWRHAVGSVMENVDNLAEPAGSLSQSTTLRGCYVPALVKGSMAWLLCLPVGQALPLASSYRSTLFFFRRGTNGLNPFPSSGESTANLMSTIRVPKGETGSAAAGSRGFSRELSGCASDFAHIPGGGDLLASTCLSLCRNRSRTSRGASRAHRWPIEATSASIVACRPALTRA